MANIEIPVSLGLKDAQSQINQLRQALQQSVKLDSSAGKSLTSILDSAQKSVDKLTGKMSNAFKSASGSSSFLKDYEKMIDLLSAATQKMTNLGVTDIKFSVSDQQVVDATIQKIQSLQQSLESIQDGKAIEVINMSQANGIDNLRQQLQQLKIDASKLSFNEIGEKLQQAADSANTTVKDLTNNIQDINSQIGKLNTQGFQEITKLSDTSTKGVARIMDAGNVDAVNNKLQQLAQSMKEIVVKPATVTQGDNIESIIENQTKAIEKKYNEQIQAIQSNKDKINSVINDIKQAGARTSNNGKTSYGHWTNEQMQQLMSMPSVENIIKKLKADTTLNFDSLGIREQFTKFRETLNQELASLNTQEVNLQSLRDNVKTQVTQVFDGVGEAVVGSRSQLQSSIKSLFSNLGINGDELKKIFDINSISSGEKMLDVINRIKAGLTSYIATLDKTANTDLATKLQAAQTAFNDLTNAQNTNKAVSQESGNAAQSLQDQINTLATQIQDLINKYNALTGQSVTFDPGNIEGAKNQIEGYIQSLNKLQQKQQALGNIQMAVNRWMGFWQVLNMTKSAINDMKQHIQELDSVMTSISVVTNFSQEDLWGQISQYSKIARQYGVAIKGVYEVSQIYYQQGLQQNDVMTLTTETLKMARIAGLDYATAADYMTTAIRGFKLEMTDAAHVTDVFSALAATTASSTEEIAVAISKTAASAQAVGASFEATSAMMATMIATTRESATNIGTALKSVISRYGEMTSDPSKTVDSEGEEMSLNRVDKALQTVGITIHDNAGQFRDFDDVMLELMEKWDSLDSLSQRYIATLMAGNRQQSRFLALVSNVDEYKKALQTAMDSEGTGELQTLKTLDSIDAKIEKMKVTIQEFYTSSGLEDLYKNVLDIITNIVSAANSLQKSFGNFPLLAVALGTQLIATVKSVISLIIAQIQLGLNSIKGTTNNILIDIVQAFSRAGDEAGNQLATKLNAKIQSISKSKAFVQIANIVGSVAQLVGSGLITSGVAKYGASMSPDEDKAAARQTSLGAGISVVGGIISGAAMGSAAGPVGMIVGALGGIATSLPSLITALDMGKETLARKIELDKKAETQAKEQLSRNKGEQKSLESALSQLQKLRDAQYESADAAKEYTDYMNQLGDQYPNLISSIDQAGNSIIEITNLEEKLAEARKATALSTVLSIQKEKQTLEDTKTAYDEMRRASSAKESGALFRELFGTTYRRAGLTGTNEEVMVRRYAELTGDQTLLESVSTGNREIDQYAAKSYLSSNYATIIDALFNDSSITENLRDTFIDYIKNIITEYKDRFKDDSQLLGYINIESIDDLDQKNIKELLLISEKINDYANSLYNSTASTLNSVSEALINAEISQAVQDRLNEMAISNNEQDKNNAKKLQKYFNLMSFIYSGMGDALPSEQVMDSLEKWIIKNETEADKLLSLDYSQYRTFEEIGFSRDFPEEAKEAFKQAFNNSRDAAVDLYKNQLEQIFGKGNSPLELYSGNFNNRTLSVIQSDLTKYSSMLESGNLAGAEAYLNNIKMIYEAIGSLTNIEDQQQVYSTIKDLDLSDPEALRSAGETLTNMGGTFANLAPTFTNAALRWATNAAILLESLSSSTQETAKSIESSIADMNKVFKYSEALEKAQALIDANKDQDLKFDQLYTFDKDVGGYIKTAKAYNLEMEALANAEAKNVNQTITDLEETLSIPLDGKSLVRYAYRKSQDSTNNEEDRKKRLEEAKELFAKQTQTEVGDIKFDRLWQEYTQIVDAFENRENKSVEWDEFVEDYIVKNATDLEERLKEIQEMPEKLVREALQSYDYTSIVSGKGTTQSKEELKALLTGANKRDASDILRDFDKYYLELLKGNVEEYNKYLEHYGLGDYKASKSEVNRVHFEATLTAASELGENKVYEALSGPTKVLLEEYGITSQETYTNENIASAMSSFNEALANYINSGVATISEVASYIDSQALQQGIGKQKLLLDAYNDQEFSTEELMKLGAITNAQYNSNNQLISYDMADVWKELLVQNKATGAWGINKVTQAKGQKAIINALANAYGINLDYSDDSYIKAFESGIEANNKKQQKQNTDLVAKSVIEQLSNAKVGSVIDAHESTLAQKILRAAGFNVSADGQVTIASEEELDAGIAKLEEVLNDDTKLSYQLKDANPETMKYIKGMISSYKTSHSKYSAISNVLGSTVTGDAAKKLAESMGEYGNVQTYMTKELGFIFEESSGLYLATDDSIANIQEKIVELSAELDNVKDPNAKQYLQDQIATFQATLDDLRNSRAYKRVNALTSLLGNYTDVTNQNIQDFQTQFSDLTDININDYLVTSDLTGKRSLKIEELRKALEPYSEQLGIDINQAFADYVGEYADTYTKSVSDAISYSKSGTTSLKEMEDFVKNYNELLGESIITDEAFIYDSELQSWLLNSDLMLKYAQARAQQLGLIDADLETYINDLLKSDVANQIDQSLSGLLDGSEKETQDLQDALRNYYINFYEKERQSAINNAKKSAQLLEKRQKDLNIHGKLTLKADNKSVILDSGFDHVKTVEEIETEYAQKISNDVQVAIDTLKAGGSNAVAIYKIFNPNATEEELAKIYSAAFDNWSSVVKQLSEVTQGSFVTGHLRDILAELNMLDGENVVNSSFDMVAVYRNIYDQMAQTNGATISGLNDVYAELLTTEDRQNVDIVDMLKNASGMSYDSLGKLLARYNITLEEVLKNEVTAAQFGLERTGFGQARLTNWETFAKSVFNTDDLKALYNNPDYISAYHSYIDGLITMNETAEDIIKSGIETELTSLGKIKRGDTLNFSYLDRAFNDMFEQRYDQFTPKKIADYKGQLAMFGATFENGILDISEDANLINIASVFQTMINDSGLQLTEATRAAFEDSIQQIISAYTTAITKGIEGGLTNVEANDLRMQAADLGVENITFEQTTKGLQLSQKFAIELYQAMAKVDELQGKILFDKLADQLSKTNENFASTEALLNHMVDLSTELAKVDGKVPDSRRAEYEAELAIAKEIVAVRSTQKDDSFNFMSNKIPEGQNNPLNYAKNWTQAIKAINDAYKVKNTKNRGKGQTTTGYMAYENFYNIINEINNMAGIMGKPITVGKTIEDGALTLDGSLESASSLIIKGIESLTAVDTGEMMVNIGGLGISLAKGGRDLKSGIDDGIDAIADAQISALDGTIAMLELIVAMESLGDVAGDDMEIKLGEIVVDGEFTEQWNTSLKNLQDYYETHTEFRKVADNIVVDNKKFMDWMKRDASDWDDADAAFLSALYKAAESTNWNLDKVADSLQGFLSGSGIEKFNKTFSLTLNDISYVVSHGVVIEVADWTNENTKAALKEYMAKSGKSEEKARADILTALESYSKGEGTTGDVPIETVLNVKHSTLIQHDKKGSYVEDSKGNKHYEGSAEYTETVDKAIMTDMKDITSGENVTVKEKVIETDYGIKNKIHMKGTLQADKSMKWEVTDLPEGFEDFEPSSDAHSQSTVLQEMYDWGLEEHKITKTQFPTKEAWIYQTFGYHVAINTEIYKDGNQVTEPSKDPKFRQQLNDFKKKSQDDIEKAIKKDSEGHVTIDLGKGYTMKFNWDEISTDGENPNMNLLMEKLFNVGGGDSALKDTIVASITAALTELPNLIANIKSDGIESLAAAMQKLADAVQLLQNAQWGTISEGINSLNKPQQQQQQNQNSDNQSTTETTNITTIVTKFEPDTAAVENAKKEISDEPVTMKIDGDERDAIDAGERAKATINAMHASINISTTGNATGAINSIINALTNLANGGRPYVANIQARVIPTQPGKAAGTLGLAKSKGTLMGELGPELVVSKGRYFVVGQSGPEMVDLDDDAIVFNHLQTQSLLTKGMSSGRGRAVTNEHNAVSFATGNVDGGPAMASAAAALATLKQLRAMWEALLGASVSDLAGAGGGGGGGGGGGKIVDPGAWVKTVERWYNLTQEIAKLEKDITHEEILRSKLQSDFNKNGKHYYNSQKQSLSALKQQIAAQEQLNLSRQDYYTKRVDALKNEPLGKLYTFDDQGQMHFRNDVTMNGQKGAMNFLTDLMGFDENGKANYTNEQKYNILKQYGFDEYMKYDSNGQQILLDADHSGDVTDEEREQYYQQATEAWRDRMDSYAQETQSLWDSIKEGEDSVLELQEAQNELLEEMRENQLDVEEAVLKAIEDMRQREIDALQDERDKLEESTGKYIQGLSDALNKEQEMYNNQQSENDLNQQRRRLAILQRSGGSAADIANLQNEIDSNERSRYFDLQQQQIDAIQEASDLQIERMDDQIQLMTETLEYQKEFGLLWGNVYEVMNESAAVIANFIHNGDSEFWAKSPLGSATALNETLFQAEQWEEYRKDLSNVKSDVAILANATRAEMKANDYKIYNDAMIKEFGKNYDSSGKYKKIFEQVYDETGDITKASAAARAAYQEDKKKEKTQKSNGRQNLDASAIPGLNNGGNASNNTTNTTHSDAHLNDGRGKLLRYEYESVNASQHKKIPVYSIAGRRADRGTLENHSFKSSKVGNATIFTCSVCKYKYTASTFGLTNQQNSNSLLIAKYASGGMNYNTGLAHLDGTPERPEAIFNPEQTKVLRENILSNKPNSLISLLSTYNEAYKNGIPTVHNEQSDSLIIENATVNMNVQQIANDYDAKRAGEQALNEMLRIARKTSAANSIRR